jgi:trimethylamine---corrinoid protein Co-methyltransferase
MKPGERLKLRVLSREETDRVHQAALRILSEIGIAVREGDAQKILKQKGCREGNDGYLLFEEALVYEALSSVPSRMALYDRKGGVAVDTDDTLPRFGPGGNCLNILDHRTGVHRPCLRQDIVETARLCEKLPHIDAVLSLGSPSDVPPQEEALETVKAITENTSKPLAFIAHDEIESDQVWTYLSEVAGGWKSLAEKPFALELTGPTSPLKIGEEACRRLRRAARRRLPVVCFPGAMPGATAPVTLAGVLAQFAAETLAGIVIHQLENPGSPVISGGGILPMDMRTGNISYGGPEYMLIGLAEVDYLHDIGIPSWSGSGCSDSHTIDAQAAAEAGMNILASALTGTSFTHNLGYLSAGKTGSLEMLVLCDELAGMARRFARGISVSEETLAFPVIAGCGKTGEYLVSEHTLRHFRTEMWVPSMFQRSALTPWIDSGSKPMGERIREKIRDLLNE